MSSHVEFYVDPVLELRFFDPKTDVASSFDPFDHLFCEMGEDGTQTDDQIRGEGRKKWMSKK